MGTAMEERPIPAPTVNRPIRSTSLLNATPIITAPIANMRLATRIIGFLPKACDKGPPTKANSQAVATYLLKVVYDLDFEKEILILFAHFFLNCITQITTIDYIC